MTTLYAAVAKRAKKSSDHEIFVGIFEKEEDAELAARLECQEHYFEYEAWVVEVTLNVPRKSYKFQTWKAVTNRVIGRS